MIRVIYYQGDMAAVTKWKRNKEHKEAKSI